MKKVKILLHSIAKKGCPLCSPPLHSSPLHSSPLRPCTLSIFFENLSKSGKSGTLYYKAKGKGEGKGA